MARFAQSTRNRVAVLTMVVSAALVLGLGTAVANESHVVPPGGKVAGTGYAFWLKWEWQWFFSHTPPYPACETVTVNRHKVGFLGIKSIAPGASKYKCSEPAGRPLYFATFAGECSTFHGDHPLGTSNSQLRRCARKEFTGLIPTVHTTIDGHAVDVMKLVAGPTRVFRVRLAPHNFIKSKKRRGRSSAYGFGLLLTGLSKGTHVIHTMVKITEPAPTKWDFTWTVKVQ
jgi:hypothetical protein